MSDTEALVELFNSANSGPSPYGESHHKVWIECGRKAQLAQSDRENRLALAAEDIEPEIGSERPDKVSSLMVGVYAHKLWEGRIKRQFGADLVWDSRDTVFNASFRQALQVYADYVRHWGFIEQRFGCEIVGTEVSLGGPAVADQVVEKLGGPYTGRADCIVNITDPDTCERNTGLRLLPGRYIYDLKTGEKHGSDDATLYGSGIQGKGYLWLDTLENGEASAQGMIFDRVVWGHKTVTREKAYAAYVTYPDINTEEIVGAMVKLSARSKREPMPNPLACKDRFGRVCWFKTSGRCQGF